MTTESNAEFIKQARSDLTTERFLGDRNEMRDRLILTIRRLEKADAQAAKIRRFNAVLVYNIAALGMEFANGLNDAVSARLELLKDYIKEAGDED